MGLMKEQLIEGSRTNLRTFSQRIDLICAFWQRKSLSSRTYHTYSYFLTRHITPIVTDYASSVEYARGSHMLDHNHEMIWSVALSDGGRRVFTGCSDGTISCWDLTLDRLLCKWQSGHLAVNTLAVHKQILVSGHDDCELVIYDADSLETKHILIRHTDRVTTVNFSDNGKYIVSGSADETVFLWCARAGKCLKRFATFETMVFTALFVDDESVLIASMYHKLVRVNINHDQWVDSDKIVLDRQPRITQMSVNCDRSLIGISMEDTTVFMSWPEMMVEQNLDQGGSVICFHPTIPYIVIIASMESNRCIIVNLDRNLFVGILDGHKYNVNAVCFTPDGSRVISVSTDETVGVWEMPHPGVFDLDGFRIDL